jgi:hypothetical protein
MPPRDVKRGVDSHHGNPNGFQGLWDGVVVDDVDPMQIGRVRVRIFDLHDEDTPVADIPWASPCFPSAFMRSGDQWASGGLVQIPPIDALVNVMFKRGDPDFPVWMGGWFPERPMLYGRELYTSNNPRKVLYNADGRPSCPTWRSLRGHVIEFDDEVPELRITSVNGHKITLSDGAGEQGDCIKIEDHAGNFIWMQPTRRLLQIRFDGDVEEHISGNKHIKVEGNMVVEVGGEVSVSAGAKVDVFAGAPISLDGPMINLNCGVAAEVPANVLEQGDPSAGDYVGTVLARLGNSIRKIVTGS